MYFMLLSPLRVFLLGRGTKDGVSDLHFGFSNCCCRGRRPALFVDTQKKKRNRPSLTQFYLLPHNPFIMGELTDK